MVFSSAFFIYGFMPVFFSLYYLCGDRWKNPVILAASLVFYLIGAGSTVLLLLLSVVFNQFLAIHITRAGLFRREALLWIGVIINVATLGYYKYGTFIWQLAGNAADLLKLENFPAAPFIPLPIGISFFTFQAVSYLMDVYRREVPPATSYAEFATYHSLFPQLVAGPIVRYREIKEEMLKRRLGWPTLTEGAYRFCLGLGKKMVIADNLGVVVDAIFSLKAGELDPLHAWLGIFCYSLQIYFDFSGYSDMAIGLGRLLGFHFPENFRQPYLSENITEFWRRWHMTLSRWFRDYLYLPLGGNRHGHIRTFFNLWIVFFLCGLWHGAGLTFIVWGLYHGLLLIVERAAHSLWEWRPSGLPGIALSFVLVMIGWVFFRAPTLSDAAHYLGTMFLFEPHSAAISSETIKLTPDILFYLALGSIFAFVPLDRLGALRWDRIGVLGSQLMLAIVSFAYSAILLAANSFNPFIYFRF
jgi:alginate O-acetyltransferase complex protein AlgI